MIKPVITVITMPVIKPMISASNQTRDTCDLNASDQFVICDHNASDQTRDNSDQNVTYQFVITVITMLVINS